LNANKDIRTQRNKTRLDDEVTQPVEISKEDFKADLSKALFNAYIDFQNETKKI
jgi:hypothetical protein